MDKSYLIKMVKTISRFGLLMIFGLMVTSASLAATEPCSITDTPNAPVQRVVLKAPPGTTNALNQPPDQANGFFSDPNCGICMPNSKQAVADNFALTDQLMVNQVVLWGIYYTDNTPLAVDDFTVIIHQDDAGIPGTIVYNQSHIVPTDRIDTGIDLFGVDEYQFTLDLPNPATLAAGTYWIEIYNDTGSGSDTNDFAWETGTLDPTNGIPGISWSIQVPGTGWNSDNTTNFAFQINYVPAIPTMNEWGMIILSLLLAGFSFSIIRRRKTQV